jgi:hypothetical protein
MTVSQLYALYCAGHAEARSLVRAIPSCDDLAVSGAGVTALERLILELALLDATNGTAQRTRLGFERALADGADVLSALGLSRDRLGRRAAHAGGSVLDEAA